jgi:autotransporter-associated beta strand protein
MVRSSQGSHVFPAAFLLFFVLWWPVKGAGEEAGPDFYAAPFVGGQAQWVVFVNDLVGWRPFAEAGFLGSSTVVGNIEAGHIWTGHEAFARDPLVTNSFITYTNAHALNELDFHATMVGHVLAGSGFDGTNYSMAGLGMVPQATVLSGSVATSFSSAILGSFSTSYESVVTPYRAFMTGEGVPAADVINSSWGGSDPGAASFEALALDGLAAQNPYSALVASAGNSASAPVGWPGSGYNAITVGALGGNAFMSPAGFSSRGLVDFYNPVTGIVTSNARVAVDISAPGELLFLAAYLGDEGGLAAADPGSVQEPSPTDLYFVETQGTSFSGPTVAGALAVLKDVANRDALWNLNGLANAMDTRVVKSVLMAGASKTFGWDNGQATATNGAVLTTRALDAATGAGALNMVRAGDAYFLGTTDVDGPGGGAIASQGWDFGTAAPGGTNDYLFGGAFGESVELTVSLNWFAGRSFDMDTNLGSNLSFADLNLEVWEVSDGSFNSLVASSSSVFNNAEYLRLDLAGDKRFGLRVVFDGMVFDQTGGVTAESYGLAWLAKPYTKLYWNGGAVSGGWNGITDSWNASPPGTNAPTAAVTTGMDQLFIAPASTNALSIVIDGQQMARSINVEEGAVTFTGINGAAVNLQNGGLSLGVGADGNATLASSVSLLISGNQVWNNASAFDLSVGSAVTGQGSLGFRNTGTGSIVLSGALNSAGALTNSGSGSGTTSISGAIGKNVTGVTQNSATSRLILAGTNTYTGNTTVAEGELTVTGNISASSQTTVEEGGTLSGSGTVGDTIILAGGTGSPGNSPGTMTVEGDLFWSGGGHYNWQIHDALGTAGQPLGWDLYNVSGRLDLSALTVGSRFNINLWSLSAISPDASGNAVNFNPSQDYLWVIVSTGLGVEGFDESFFNINVVSINGTDGFANVLSGGVFAVRSNGGDLELTFTANPVPEPGTWAMLMLAAVLCVALVRRQHRTAT